MERIFSKTRFTTCIPPALGGSGNPSVPTARGVLVGLKATLEFLGKDLKDCHIAVQVKCGCTPRINKAHRAWEMWDILW